MLLEFFQRAYRQIRYDKTETSFLESREILDNVVTYVNSLSLGSIRLQRGVYEVDKSGWHIGNREYTDIRVKISGFDKLTAQQREVFGLQLAELTGLTAHREVQGQQFIDEFNVPILNTAIARFGANEYVNPLIIASSAISRKTDRQIPGAEDLIVEENNSTVRQFERIKGKCSRNVAEIRNLMRKIRQAAESAPSEQFTQESGEAGSTKHTDALRPVEPRFRLAGVGR